jgi:redox-regulated HSP33 family molecular chaperone
MLLGRDETRAIARERERLEVRCEFCATEYVLEPDEVGALLPDA